MIAEALRWAAPATAWMLTYLLHSTLLLGAAWLLSRRLAGRGQTGRGLALEETLWRAALVGGLVTASLQVGLDWRPVAGGWTLAEVPAVTAGAGATLAAGNGPSRAPVLPAAGSAGSAHRAAGTPSSLADVRPAAAGTAGAGLGSDPARLRAGAAWPLLAVAAWLAVAAVLLAGLAAARRRLARTLRERWTVQRGALPALLGRLRARAGLARPVRLTGSERLPVPIAFGLARPEICLPERAVREMSPYHQESILAHELAHLLRRDPAWLTLARTLEAALFFQPLNRLARRRLQEIAEYRCDDRAVELTGRPLELARCLTEVAAWRLAESSPLPVPTMAVPGGSALSRRVRRLLDGEPRTGRRLPRWLAAAAAAALLAVAALVPGVTAAPGEEPPPAPADLADLPSPAELAELERLALEELEIELEGMETDVPSLQDLPPLALELDRLELEHLARELRKLELPDLAIDPLVRHHATLDAERAQLSAEERAELAARVRRKVEQDPELRAAREALRREVEGERAAARERAARLRAELERELGPGSERREEMERELAASRAELERELARHRAEVRRALDEARREMEREAKRETGDPRQPVEPPH